MELRVRFPPDLYRRFKIYAATNGQSMSAITIHFISKLLGDKPAAVRSLKPIREKLLEWLQLEGGPLRKRDVLRRFGITNTVLQELLEDMGGEEFEAMTDRGGTMRMIEVRKLYKQQK